MFLLTLPCSCTSALLCPELTFWHKTGSVRSPPSSGAASSSKQVTTNAPRFAHQEQQDCLGNCPQRENNLRKAEMEQMFLSASIISRWADWESGIGVTCWHQQSSDLSARRCAGAAAAIPARQGAGTCTASLDYSQINTWRRLLRPTGGCAAENLRTTASQGLPISRKLQSAAHRVFSTS